MIKIKLTEEQILMLIQQIKCGNLEHLKLTGKTFEKILGKLSTQIKTD